MESQPRDAADHADRTHAPAGGTALVFGYIENRAQAPEADVVSRLNASLHLVETLRARLSELEGADLRARDLQGIVDALTVQNIRLAEKLSALEGADLRARELQRTVEALTAQNTQLAERVRELEIGFRRFVHEGVSSEQLELALTKDAVAAPPATSPDTSAGSEAGPPPDTSLEANPAPEASETTAPQPAAETPPSGSDPEPEKEKKRHNHGRRRQFSIPKVIIEILPPEVQREGLANFERIGHEDSSSIGHRRGGPIELISRRPKYVRIETSSTTQDSTDALAREASGDTDEAPGENASSGATPPAQEAPITGATSPAQEAPVTGATSPAPTGAKSSCVIVRQHEVARVPADTAFKNNPFIDGAIVCYAPPSTDCEGPVLIAELPERPLSRSLVDASLLARLLVNKFDYHTPFYRQEIEASRQGCPNSRGNMSRWQFEAGNLALRIVDAAWQDALTRSWLGTDATGTAIQAKDKYRYGHVFVLVAPGDSVLFRFTPKYDGDTVKGLYGGYTGTIVADASANHNILFGPGKACEAGCWCHARKPFVKAFNAGEGKSAAFALKTIKSLFRIEQKIALLSPDERLKVRQRDSAPLVDALFEWADRELLLAPEDSFVHKGLVYLKNQKEALREFLRNGEIPIHNNACERALRRVVKGRQNWLSHGSDDHAERACAISSLIASCELHGLDPEFYLQEVLTVAPSWPVQRMLELTPKHWVDTRQRLIAEGSLSYIDLAQILGSRLAYPAR